MKYLFLSLIFLPAIAFAAEPVWLIEVPLTNGQVGFSGYINFLYLTTISLAALLAVIKIIIAGVKYMLSDIVTNKSDAINDIRGAIFGLIIILGAFLVLNTINPNLTNSSVSFTTLRQPNVELDPPPVRPSAPPSGGTTPPAGGTTPPTGGTTPPTGGTTPPTGGTTPPGGGTTEPPATTYTCIKGEGTRTQGTVTYQYFDLSSCTNTPLSLTHLRTAICTRGPVLNQGNGVYYCKQ